LKYRGVEKLSAILRLLGLPVLLSISVCAVAADTIYTYEAIAKRHEVSQLDTASVEEAKMQGECLVGLKELNFQKRDDFDPVAEWTSLRAFSLLEQVPPCTVLIMIEVAREGLLKMEAEK
jgi:hypothetical protein